MSLYDGLALLAEKDVQDIRFTDGPDNVAISFELRNFESFDMDEMETLRDAFNAEDCTFHSESGIPVIELTIKEPETTFSTGSINHGGVILDGSPDLKPDYSNNKCSCIAGCSCPND